jgi:hypothetical protein
LIVNSATYRQSSAFQKYANSIDPEDKWLWRFPIQRLDAEAIRDAMLASTGELDQRLGGPFVPKDKTEEGQYVISETQPDARRRSLYLQQRRTTPVTFVDVFDGARMNPNCVQRTSSTVALQSLALLNSDFVRNRSKAFAQRITKATAGTPERVDLAFRLAIGRAPTKAEVTAVQEFLQPESPSATPDSGSTADWIGLCQMIFASNAFLFVE